MERFNTFKGIAAPFNILNVDTDKIIPKQFSTTIKRTGLGKHVFDEMRYKKDGSENPNFVLNQKPYDKSNILIAGDNFGCGSSREHAPWALKDFGIKCIISTSFADIFFNNSFKNGLLFIMVTKDEWDPLLEDAKYNENSEIEIDLENQEIRRPNGGKIKFKIDPFRKKCLLEGLDDIGLTELHENKIKSFEESRSTKHPWL